MQLYGHSLGDGQRTYLKVLEDLYNMTAISDRSKAIPERVDRDPGTALSRS
jgi:predicted transcriptional regulator